MATTTTEIEDFMTGPLVTWFSSCLENPSRLADYEDLTDGVLLYEVLLQIDPEPVHHGVAPSLGNITARIRNMDIIIKNIKALYEEEFCQVLLVVPDCIKLGRSPETKAGLENMHLLLLLLLGCAVQCPNKETFIYRIKQMNVEDQHAIVDCIKQVTDNQQLVISQELPDTFSPDVMMTHIRRLVKERDEYLQNWTGMVVQDRGENEAPTEHQRKASTPLSTGDTHHLAVELADWKARLRKQRQELEEKTEALVEAKEEIEHNKILVTKLRQEVQELMQDARAAKAYRDELDAVRERAERVDKLESEVQRYRERLSDIDFYKTRVEEMREDNRVLLETREMLEEQLERAQRRGDLVLELESDLLSIRTQANELTLERDAAREQLFTLLEEHAALQLAAAAPTRGPTSHDDSEEEICEGGGGSGDNSLSEQLTSSAQARALRLELENRKLLSTIESLKEASFHESSGRILELEKEKKRLSMKVDQLQENSQSLNQQNLELEQLFKDAITENRKLQNTIDALKTNAEKHSQEIQMDKTRITDLQKNVETVTKEKQRLQCLLESLQRRADEQEKTIESTNQQIKTWKIEASCVPELQSQLSGLSSKVETLDKDNQNSQKEISKLRKTIEEKEVALDQYANKTAAQEKENKSLMKELDDATAHISRMHEVERASQELVSRAAVDKETVETLQKDLVAEKLNNQQLKTSLEKLGIDLDQLFDPDTALERIVSSAEVVRAVQEFLVREGKLQCAMCQPMENQDEATQELTSLETMKVERELLVRQCDELRQEVSSLQSLADGLHSDNAKLQVNISTLQSQISSLSTQHTALQLANSQLVAEKDELVKGRATQDAAHQQLLHDQNTLQTLHEQLTAEHETALQEREGLKTSLRDLRSENRGLREQVTRQEAAHATLEQEHDKLRQESRSLANLRAEHSSLKDDFRNLFTASEKLKTEYRSLQEEYRVLRAENGALRLRHTELQGEMAKRSDHATLLEVEVSKLSSRCEVLLQMNTGLEDDRRSLMEHVSLLLSQYHELLTHSLEDKEHYHMEEKLFTDKLNNLCRQKEKLEEKIMEHYRKMESCSTKKKSFGATLVKRVRKAGSDFMSKVPRNRRSWHEDAHQGECRGTLNHGSESGEGGNESDTSLDDVRTRHLREHHNSDGYTQSTLSLGSAGTRRTVYYTGENNNDAGEESHETFVKDEDGTLSLSNSTAADATGAPSVSKDRPLIVYNRISTMIGAGLEDTATPRCPPSPNQGSVSSQKGGAGEDNKQGTSKGKGKGENSIWYEYGCV